MLFWRKNKNDFNKIELEKFVFHRSESIYDYFYTEPRKKKYGIHTVVKNVPITVERGDVSCKS